MKWFRFLSPVLLLAASDARPEGADGAATGVVYIVGVAHAPAQFRSPAMSPGHVRAALALLEPEVICVESQPDWFAEGRFYRQTYEAQGIAVPAAREAGLAVYGIDWIGDSSGHYWERQRVARCRLERERLDGGSPDPGDYAYGASTAGQLRVVDPASLADFLHLNGAEFGRERIDWLDSRRDEPGSPQAYIAVRDGHIAKHIAAVADERPSERIVVILGAAHKANLTRLLKARGLRVGDLDVLEEAADLRAGAAMDAWLTGQDLVAMLVAAYDDSGGVTLPPERMQRLWSRLDELVRSSPTEELATWRAYLAARQRMLAGDLEAAKRGFRLLAERDAAPTFPHPGSFWRGHLTVAQAARLECGRLADLDGDRDAALAHYRSLLEDLPAPSWSEDYHGDFEFLATARNAVRALVERPYEHGLAWRTSPAAVAARPAPAADAARARAKLKEAWTLYRQERWEELDVLSSELEDTAGLVKMELLEVIFFQAEIALRTDDPDRARRKIEKLDTLMEGVSANHWLRPMLKDLESRITDR